MGILLEDTKPIRTPVRELLTRNMLSSPHTRCLLTATRPNQAADPAQQGIQDNLMRTRNLPILLTKRACSDELLARGNIVTMGIPLSRVRRTMMTSWASMSGATSCIADRAAASASSTAPIPKSNIMARHHRPSIQIFLSESAPVLTRTERPTHLARESISRPSLRSKATHIWLGPLRSECPAPSRFHLQPHFRLTLL